MFLNLIYIAAVVVVMVFGMRHQRHTKRMWTAAQKPSHTDELRWTATQRQALMRESEEERQAREYRAACASFDQMRVKPPIGG